MLHKIPKPEMLDGERVLRPHGTRFTPDERPDVEVLSDALHESCAYADQLWEHLNEVRAYLLGSLPPDPRLPGPHRTASASPTGPDDEEGWTNWMNAFAAVSSVLCGPKGDSGFGISRAREEAKARRDAPVLNIRAAHPDLEGRPLSPEGGRPSGATPPPPTAASTVSPDAPAASSSRWTPGWTATVLAVGAVGLRSLRPRRTT